MVAAGCTPTSPTVAPDTSTPTVAPLPVDQAMKAALAVSDLPKGWDGGVSVEPSAAPGRLGQYDPPECMLANHPFVLAGHPTTDVVGQYFVREPLRTVHETIMSWST